MIRYLLKFQFMVLRIPNCRVICSPVKVVAWVGILMLSYIIPVALETITLTFPVVGKPLLIILRTPLPNIVVFRPVSLIRWIMLPKFTKSRLLQKIRHVVSVYWLLWIILGMIFIWPMLPFVLTALPNLVQIRNGHLSFPVVWVWTFIIMISWKEMRRLINWRYVHLMVVPVKWISQLMQQLLCMKLYLMNGILQVMELFLRRWVIKICHGKRLTNSILVLRPNSLINV